MVILQALACTPHACRIGRSYSDSLLTTGEWCKGTAAHHKCVDFVLSFQILHDTLTTCATMVCSIFMMSLKVAVPALRNSCAPMKMQPLLSTTPYRPRQPNLQYLYGPFLASDSLQMCFCFLASRILRFAQLTNCCWHKICKKFQTHRTISGGHIRWLGGITFDFA